MKNDPLHQDILKALSVLGSMIDSGYNESLDTIKFVDRILSGNPVYDALRLGVLVDLATTYQNIDLLEKTAIDIQDYISDYEKNHRTILIFELYYFLGTALQALSSLTESDYVPPERPSLQMAKEAFRASIENIPLAVFNEYIPRAIVNYGNLLSSIGRHFEALQSYDQAILYDPRHTMALGNKGIELAHYAWMTGSHPAVSLFEARELMIRASDTKNIENAAHFSAVQTFRHSAEALSERFIASKIDLEHIESHIHSQRQAPQDPYHSFIRQNGLYLNVCIHDWECDEQDTDSLYFDYITPHGTVGLFQSRTRVFNEAKELYATARYLAYLSSEILEFYDEDSSLTRYADLLEYANHGLKAGVLKSAFTVAYSILDRIATFLNDELGINMPQKSVHFDTFFWPDFTRLKIKKSIALSNDPNILALADLARDLSKGPDSSKELRNAIAHRMLVVHASDKMTGPGSTAADHILYRDLLKRTLDLIVTCKAALIYLASYLHQKLRSQEEASEGTFMPMSVLWQDDFVSDPG